MAFSITPWCTHATRNRATSLERGNDSAVTPPVRTLARRPCAAMAATSGAGSSRTGISTYVVASDARGARASTSSTVEARDSTVSMWARPAIRLLNARMASASVSCASAESRHGAPRRCGAATASNSSSRTTGSTNLASAQASALSRYEAKFATVSAGARLHGNSPVPRAGASISRSQSFSSRAASSSAQ